MLLIRKFRIIMKKKKTKKMMTIILLIHISIQTQKYRKYGKGDAYQLTTFTFECKY